MTWKKLSLHFLKITAELDIKDNVENSLHKQINAVVLSELCENEEEKKVECFENICTECGKSFKSRKQLKRHLKSHDVPTNQCEMCKNMKKVIFYNITKPFMRELHTNVVIVIPHLHKCKI